MASTTTSLRTPSLARLLAPRPIAGAWRNGARLGFGGFFLAMATFNATVILPNAAASYKQIADELAWPGFDWLLRQLVVPAAVPVTVLLIAFEVGVAVLVLSKGRRVRLGLLAAIAFMIGLAPLLSWYELGNVPPVAVALLLLGRDYDHSFRDMPPLSSFSRSRRLRSVGLLAGLVVLLGLLAPGGQAASRGQTRTYYLAADEVRWDYAPLGFNNITGRPFGEAENVFVQQGPDRIGKVYVKALYREYTDATFTHRKPRPARWQHLGLLGPVIQAEVDDTIVVHFKNHTRFAMSLHPHGVFYRKDSEGAGYNDATSGRARADDAVPPGGRVRQVWQVPARSGPGPNDPSSVLWMYHSHVDESGDTNAGLVGPIIVTAKGKARRDGSPKDVDRQFVTLFTVFDENRSPYLDLNIRTFAGDPSSVDKDDEDFHESNLMHSINGYVFGNLPGLRMRFGERVRWYPFAMGTEVDLHTPHWHANTLLWNGNRVDLVETLPASMKMLDMAPDNPGTWLYHCHVNDHIDAGMAALYTVRS